MNESDKDWKNPIFLHIYGALAIADKQRKNDDIVNWLNANGFCNLTCCPECHTDDFTHVEGCSISNGLDVIANRLEQLARTGEIKALGRI